MSSSCLFYLLFCLSLHACNARLLGFPDHDDIKEVAKKDQHTSKGLQQGAEKEKIRDDGGTNSIISSRGIMPSLLEIMFHLRGKAIVAENKDEQKNLTSRDTIDDNEDEDAVASKRNDSKGSSMDCIKGSNNMSVQVVSQGDQQTEEWKRQARSMQESGPHDRSEETMDSKDKDIPEDVVVMDYAQPHRKPPIHNISP